MYSHIYIYIYIYKRRNLYINLFSWYVVKMKMMYEYYIGILSILTITFSD
jgi:hypothetical protein